MSLSAMLVQFFANGGTVTKCAPAVAHGAGSAPNCRMACRKAKKAFLAARKAA